MLLTARNIFKTYGNLEVLKGINLDISEGEVVSIVGPSGAGKTTLLHILGTLENADKRKDFFLSINGTPIENKTSKQLAQFRNQSLGFVFQFHGLLPEFTALENICFPALIKGVSKKKAKQLAFSLLERLNVETQAHQKPKTLSGGEQQRVAVARALINSPKLILADEPTGNLDSDNANTLHELFFEVRKQFGCCFVIVTHNQKLAKQADKIISLKDGQVI
ncbi:MAG: ABC transporter ATP-binding protein [Flavobacteriaceae bacterium]|nr:ABC transporter ATP-binding protein [Flavobacteriaceae bacterium]MCY4215420.1 ABC transporter ATP-binding protein [Flavobacteriaceae bacterium]MCY4253901.1 ABC transporter ATP-binding protein [Flavobacteriaceae bacterium]